MIRSLLPIHRLFSHKSFTGLNAPFSAKPLLPLFQEKVPLQFDNRPAASLKERVSKPEVDWFYEKPLITPKAKTLQVRGEPEESSVRDLIFSGDIEQVIFDTYEFGSLATPELFQKILSSAFEAGKKRVSVKLISFKRRNDSPSPKYNSDLNQIHEVLCKDKIPKGWRPLLNIYFFGKKSVILECGGNSTPHSAQEIAVFLAQQVRENQVRIEIELKNS